MDYLNLAIPYTKLDYPIVNKAPEINTDIEYNTSNLDYQEARPAAPTSIVIQDYEEQKAPTKKKIVSKVLPPLKSSKGLTKFNSFYDQAISNYADIADQLKSRRNLFTRLANYESSFNSGVQNRAGVPAFGYFQLMQGLYRGHNHNNIGKHAGVDTATFLNSPMLQIKAANSLANEFMRQFSPIEIQRLHKLGYSDSAIIAGAWLGGAQGVRRFAFRNQDSKDVHGTGVGKYMQMFNNL